jgi:DNA-binding CsgD family transcriptional regulator
VAARCRALVSPDDQAEPHYLRAVDLLATADTPVDLARTHLLYGEWLRRLRRRRDAREHLRRAADMLEKAGACPLAHRARTELEATGEHAREDRPSGVPELTPQENAVAGLAAQGHTNAEIGSAMFLSVNTVDYHLRKVFQKVGISSRRQLVDKMSGTPGLS